MYNDEDIFDVNGNPTATTEYDLGKFDIAIGYRNDARWGLEAVYSPTLYGENTAAGATYTMAITFQP